MHRTYPPGTLVLIRNTFIEKELNRKAKPRYLGPYKVVRQTLGSSYVLEELNGATLARLVAAFHVIPYFTRKSLNTLNEPGEEPEVESTDNDAPHPPSNGEPDKCNLVKVPEQSNRHTGRH